MKRRELISLISTALGLAACKWSGESVKRNFKVTVTAYVDGKEVKGESVYSIEWREFNSGVKEIVKGEALILDIPGRDTVFVLPYIRDKENRLFSSYHPSLIRQATGLKTASPYLTDFQILQDAAGSFDMSAGVGREKFQPVMLAFKDIHQPNTVYEVTRQNFGRLFGPRAQFGKIMLEFTEGPLTAVIGERLPWISNYDSNVSPFPKDPPGKLRSTRDVPFPYLFLPHHFSNRER